MNEEAREARWLTKPPPDGSVTVLRAVVGSTVHGTGVSDQDDRDEMALVVEPSPYVLGLQKWESSVMRTQPEGEPSGPGDLDLVVHSLRKFCQLAAAGNPTILLPLFVPYNGILESTPEGAELLRHRSMFLSQRCGKAFLGYMESQRKRLNGESGSRHGRPRQELIDKFGFDTKYAGHIVRLGYQGVELMGTGHLTLPMRREERDHVVAIRTGQVPLETVTVQAKLLEKRLEALLGNGPLPAEPEREAIDDFLARTYTKVWDRQAEQERAA